MTVVFVHGNPETDAVWGPLVDALAAHGIDDTVRLSPPGFGAPAAADWPATTAAYVSWLIGQLEAIGEPIDLVGHDWGAGHVFGLLAERPDLVRSWAADCAGLLHPDYVWHDLAQVWQTPGAGEEAVAGMVALSAEERTELYLGLGLPDSVAAPMSAGLNEDMARCVLALYRDGAQPALRQLGERVSAAALPRGLVIDATEDPYVDSALGAEMAIRLGAETLRLEGNGHWWMTEDPAAAASGLARFWAGSSS
ncbi:MAG: alpha/beta hydrolase [Actinomycetota bacterium]